MATGAPPWGTCRVYGTWYNQDGTLKQGTYKVTIPRITGGVDTGGTIIPDGPFAAGKLNTASGSASFDLPVPANDDPANSPVDWGQVEIFINFTDGSTPETYVIDTPLDGEVNLRTVILSPTGPAKTPLVVLGVPGGAAQLSADGTSVLDAHGNPIVTGGTTTQVQPDWDATSGLASIANKPTLFTQAIADGLYASAAQGSEADTAVQPQSLADGLAAKAPLVHTHTIDQVAGLQAALTAASVPANFVVLDYGASLPASPVAGTLYLRRTTAPPVSTPPALRAAGATATANATTVSATIPTVQAGDVLLLLAISSTSSPPASVPAGWTAVSGGAFTSGTSGTIYVGAVLAYKVAAGNETGATVAVTWPDSSKKIASVASFSGVDTTTPIDQITTAVNTTTVNARAIGTINIATGNTLPVLLVSDRAAGTAPAEGIASTTWTYPNGFTQAVAGVSGTGTNGGDVSLAVATAPVTSTTGAFGGGTVTSQHINSRFGSVILNLRAKP